MRLASRRNQAAGLAILPTATVLALNGLYLGAAHQASPRLFWALDVAQFVLVPGLSLWLLWRYAGVSPRHYGLGPLADRSIARALALYAIVILVFVFGYSVAKILAMFVPWGWGSTGFSYGHAFPTSPMVALLLLGYISLSAGLVEEIVYRGLPALYFSAFLSGRKLNVIYPLVSALAFAVIHWENGSRELLATFLLGLALAALYLRVRTLWPFVVGHAVTDILSFSGYYAW